MVQSLQVSEFYESRRRLAYYFAWASMILLLVQISPGSTLEFYSHPRAALGDDEVYLLHRRLTQDEADGSRLLVLDASMKTRGESLSLLDTATAVLPEGRDLTVFYGSQAAVMVDGKSSHSVDLGQKWEVLAALRDPSRGTAWIFGWKEGQIVARHREGGGFGPETPVSKAGPVDRLSASVDGATGPLVAWREKGSGTVKSALYDGHGFVPRADVEIGAVDHWEALLSRSRVLMITYRREDRTFKSVTLRLECCAGCPAPASPRKIILSEPLLLLGRKVTGLAALLKGDRLLIFVTRPSTVMTASVPLEEPSPASKPPRLQAISADPWWRNVVGSINPTLLIFCSFSLVFLGFTLLRERTRVALETGKPGPPSAEPVAAGLAPRSMAYILDLLLLMPVFYAVAGILAVSFEDMDDPHFLLMMAVWAGVEFIYHFLMEWRLGWTFGKWIIGLRVTEVSGSKLTLRGALVRNLMRLIDGEVPFGLILGLALILRTRRRQRLGDLVARTVVLQDPEGAVKPPPPPP